MDVAGPGVLDRSGTVRDPDLIRTRKPRTPKKSLNGFKWKRHGPNLRVFEPYFGLKWKVLPKIPTFLKDRKNLILQRNRILNSERRRMENFENHYQIVKVKLQNAYNSHGRCFKL